MRGSLVANTAKKHVGALVSLIALEAIGAGVSVLTPLPLQAAIDSISGKSKTLSFLPASWTNSLLTLAIASVGFAVIQQAINMASSIVATRTGQQVTVELRGQCFDAAQKRSIASHLTSGTADALYRIQTDTQALEWILLEGALPVLTATLSIIAMTAALLTLNLQLALIALVLGPILVVIGRTTRPALKSTARAAKQQESQALGIIESALSGLQTVKAYNLRSYTLARYRTIAESAVARRIRIAWLDSSLGAAVQVLCAIGLAGALYVGADAAAHGTLSPGQVILGIHYLGQIYTPIRTIGKKWASLQTQLVSLERIDFLLQTDTDVPVPTNPQAIPTDITEISLTNVSFAYDEAHPILQDVSISVRKGDVIALTGPTGIGKSTLSLQLAQKIAATGHKVLYISGEESASQLFLRAKRLGPNPPSLLILVETDMADILTVIRTEKPDFVILDSIQVMAHPDLTSPTGSISQVRYCTSELIKWIKELGSCALVIGHITKDGSLAGPKVLEHLVDVILFFEGEPNQQYREL